jgi:hypothetical protein
MAAYMIVQIKITREEGWPEYRQQVSELFAQHGGSSLVQGGLVEFQVTIKLRGRVHWLDGPLTLWQHSKKQRCAKDLRPI